MPGGPPGAFSGEAPGDTPRVVSVLPDVPAIDRAFDYLVPDRLEGAVAVGARVRVVLHGRRVAGWVIAQDAVPPEGVRLLPISAVSGAGPAAAVVELARWAAWRWAGPMATFLRTASPPRSVRQLPPAPARGPLPPIAADSELSKLSEEALAQQRAVLRLPPPSDPLTVISAALARARSERGSALVLTPSHAAADELAGCLRRAGVDVALLPGDWALAAAGATAVVGTRSAAWGPAARLSAVVVLDGQDEAYHEERAPTWVAWVVAAQRAASAGAPCVVTSPCPTLELLAWAPELRPARTAERQGWAALEIVDRRQDDPRTGLFSARVVGLLRAEARGGAERGPAVCVLNRKGRARLVACASCGELARCALCEAAVEQVGDPRILRCRACGSERPRVCLSCGGTARKVVRAGVSRVREELEALVRVPVVEVAGPAADPVSPGARVLVGTEAVLHRVSSASAVAFLDMDQELLAPRYGAGEQALALLARAARLVGGRARAGRVVVQTRLPRHAALQAALHADPGLLAATEAPRRMELGLPPATAVALVSGEGGPELAGRLSEIGRERGVQVIGPDAAAHWMVRAPDHRSLCDVLADAPRPPARVRIEVDPRRA
ncbi:MAG TPA: hypothetical protein VKI64_05330 [Acidimicrobiales bacterium]|nr:hypothetical protein [Acidimicrobiales bacterium]